MGGLTNTDSNPNPNPQDQDDGGTSPELPKMTITVKGAPVYGEIQRLLNSAVRTAVSALADASRRADANSAACCASGRDEARRAGRRTW